MENMSALMVAIVAAFLLSSSPSAFAQEEPDDTTPTSEEVGGRNVVRDVQTGKCYDLIEVDCPLDVETGEVRKDIPKIDTDPPAPAPTIKVTPIPAPAPAPKAEPTPTPVPAPSAPKGEKVPEAPKATPEPTPATEPAPTVSDDDRHWYFGAGPFGAVSFGPPIPPSPSFFPGVMPTTFTGGLQLSLSWDDGKGVGTAIIGRAGAVSPNGYTAGLTLVGFGHASEKIGLGLGFGFSSTSWDVWRMSGVGANSMGMLIEGYGQFMLVETKGADVMFVVSPTMFVGRDDNGLHSAPAMRGGLSASLQLRF